MTNGPAYTTSRAVKIGMALAAVFAVWCPCAADDAMIIAIKASRIETLAGDPIDDGVILVANGRIAAIGADVQIPDGCEVIDANEGVVFPGLVHPFTLLGLSESRDGPGTNAHYRIADALYPFQDVYRLAARAGYTTLNLGSSTPGISGQSALVRTVAESPEEMLLSDRGTLIANFRQDRYSTAGGTIKRGLESGANAGPGDNTAAVKWALDGEIPLVINCDGPGDVLHVLKLLEPHKEAKPVLVCSSGEVHEVAERLGKAKASVVVPARIDFKQYTRTRTNVPRILADAGVKLACVPPSDDTAGFQAMRSAMAELVRAGLDRETALRAITANPAEMLGLDYRLGTLQVGRDANLIVLDGDLLDMRARILRVLIDGATVYDVSWGGIR